MTSLEHSPIIPPQDIGLIRRAQVIMQPDENNLKHLKNSIVSAKYHAPQEIDNPVPDHHTIAVNSELFTPRKAREILSHVQTQLDSLTLPPDSQFQPLINRYRQLLNHIEQHIQNDEQWSGHQLATTIRHEEQHSLQEIRYPQHKLLIENAQALMPHWFDKTQTPVVNAVKIQAEIAIILKEVQAFSAQHIVPNSPDQVSPDSLWLSAYRIFQFLQTPQAMINALADQKTDISTRVHARYTIAQTILFSGSFEILEYLKDPTRPGLEQMVDQLQQRFTTLLSQPESLINQITEPRFVLAVDQQLNTAIKELENSLHQLSKDDEENERNAQ